MLFHYFKILLKVLFHACIELIELNLRKDLGFVQREKDRERGSEEQKLFDLQD